LGEIEGRSLGGIVLGVVAKTPKCTTTIGMSYK